MSALTKRVLVLIDLPQDVEVVMPLLMLGLADYRDGWDLKIVVSRWLKAAHPEAVAQLQATLLKFRFVSRSEVIAGREPDLGKFHAVITASESSHPAHAAGHALALRAKAMGLLTFTLQHGLENVGLGMGDEGEIASDVFFCWFPPQTNASFPEAIRDRLHHVGRPREEPREPVAPRFDIGVFENLHADRYADEDREAFVAGLEAIARAGARILLRPHPAGRWSAGLDLAAWPNVTLQTEGSGQAAVEASARVVTTPGTVVLDAAQAGRPVALAGRQGGGLYQPFPILRTAEDWLAFAAAADEQAEARRAFLDRVLMPGYAINRVIGRIEDDLSERLARR
jgi:hypothetical protein